MQGLVEFPSMPFLNRAVDNLLVFCYHCVLYDLSKSCLLLYVYFMSAIWKTPKKWHLSSTWSCFVFFFLLNNAINSSFFSFYLCNTSCFPFVLNKPSLTDLKLNKAVAWLQQHSDADLTIAAVKKYSIDRIIFKLFIKTLKRSLNKQSKIIRSAVVMKIWRMRNFVTLHSVARFFLDRIWWRRWFRRWWHQSDRYV